MSTLSEILVCIAFLAFLVLSILSYRRDRKLPRLLVELSCLVVLALVLHATFGFPKALFGDSGLVISKGAGNNYSDWPIFVFAYLSVVLGMLGQGLYSRFNVVAAERPPFDWGSLLAPVFVSPLVFSPLISTLGNSAGTLQGIFVVFVTAFENGFFFKAFVEQRQAIHAQASPATT